MHQKKEEINMFNLSDETFNTLSKIQKVLLAIMALASIFIG